MRYKKLSNRQFDVMSIFWSCERPMISSEIISYNSELNMNTVRSVIKALLKKGYIEVCDIVHSGNVLAQRYHALISKEEYLLSICKELQTNSTSNILVALVSEENDIEVLKKLEKIILETIKKSEG